MKSTAPAPVVVTLSGAIWPAGVVPVRVKVQSAEKPAGSVTFLTLADAAGLSFPNSAVPSQASPERSTTWSDCGVHPAAGSSDTVYTPGTRSPTTAESAVSPAENVITRVATSVFDASLTRNVKDAVSKPWSTSGIDLSIVRVALVSTLMPTSNDAFAVKPSDPVRVAASCRFPLGVIVPFAA